MYRLIPVTFYIGISIAILIFGCRFIGQTQRYPLSISQLRLLNCTPPCWLGIIPGPTTVEDAKAKLIAVYSKQTESRVKASFLSDNHVAMEVEGSNFYLFARFEISELIDAKSEIVQAINLHESRSDSGNYAPSPGDFISVFGTPQGGVIAPIGNYDGYQVSLSWTLHIKQHNTKSG